MRQGCPPRTAYGPVVFAPVHGTFTFSRHSAKSESPVPAWNHGGVPTVLTLAAGALPVGRRAGVLASPANGRASCPSSRATVFARGGRMGSAASGRRRRAPFSYTRTKIVSGMSSRATIHRFAPPTCQSLKVVAESHAKRSRRDGLMSQFRACNALLSREQLRVSGR